MSPEETVSNSDIIPDSAYTPFIFKGLVSATGQPEDQKLIRILRDTGAAQSLVLADVLPLTDQTSCGVSVIVQGIEMGCVPVPLHTVHIESDLVTGFFRVGVQPTLPIKGIDFIMGNYIAHGKVTPMLEVADQIDHCCINDELFHNFPNVFPSYVITRAQVQKLKHVNLADSFIGPMLMNDLVQDNSKVSASSDFGLKAKPVSSKLPVQFDPLKFLVSREQLVAAQQSDPSLVKSFSLVVPSEAVNDRDSLLP